MDNLRECVHLQNCMNRLNPVGASGLRGAVFLKHASKWQAQVKVNGKVRHIGLFDTAEQASNAYWAAKREVAGDFLRAA